MAPSLLGVISANKSSSITPLYDYELKKVEIFGNFEKNALKRAGQLPVGKKVTPAFVAVVADFLKDEFINLSNIEKSLQSEMAYNTKFYHFLSVFTPITSYMTTSEEVSSAGLLNLLDYYDYSIKKKNEFLNFYIDKVFVKGNNSLCKVESFIKGSENIYHGKSRLPHFFLLGLLLTIGYTAGLFYMGYRKFKQSIYTADKDELNKLETTTFEFKKASLESYYAGSKAYTDIIYAGIAGQIKELQKSGFTGKICIDQMDVTQIEKNRSFLYLGYQEDLPEDMKVADYLSLVTFICNIPGKDIKTLQFEFITKEDYNKTIGDLEDYQKPELLLIPLFLKDWDICLFSDTVRKIPGELYLKFADRIEQLAEKGSTIIYIYYDSLPTPFHFNYKTKPFCHTENWSNNIRILRQMQANQVNN